MRPEDMYSLLRAQPFRPFQLFLTNGHTYEVDHPEVIPMTEATAYFRPREQRMHRQFHVESALRVRQQPEARP